MSGRSHGTSSTWPRSLLLLVPAIVVLAPLVGNGTAATLTGPIVLALATVLLTAALVTVLRLRTPAPVPVRVDAHRGGTPYWRDVDVPRYPARPRAPGRR